MEVPQAGDGVAVGPWECHRCHGGAPQAGYNTEGDLWNQRVSRDQGWGEPQNMYGYCKGLLETVQGDGSEHKEGGEEGKWGQ